jgi:hypothetical protein
MYFRVFLYITNCKRIILEDWDRLQGGRTKTQGLMRELGIMKNFPKQFFFVRALGSDISCSSIRLYLILTQNTYIQKL